MSPPQQFIAEDSPEETETMPLQGEQAEEQELQQQEEPPHHENSSHSAVMELVYDRIVTSLSTDVAFQMHRMIKTGVYPLSDLLNPEDRTEIYPHIYNQTGRTPETEVKKYAAFHPERRKRRRLADDEETYSSSTAVALGKGQLLGLDPKNAMTAIAEQEKSQNASSTIPTDTAAAAAARPAPNSKQPPAFAANTQQAQAQTQPTHLDIWGKKPPKEPKDMVPCTLCGRQVNTLRYAPHLDKCMGIGTTVRQAALAASGFVPANASRSGPK